jgi:hypothetical protein
MAQESLLQSQHEKLSELEMNGVGNKDDIEKQLQEISTKLEKPKPSECKGCCLSCFWSPAVSQAFYFVALQRTSSTQSMKAYLQ